MVTQMKPKVGDLFELFDEILGGMDDSTSPLQILNQSFQKLFNMSVRGVWLNQDGDWQYLGNNYDDELNNPFSVENMKTETDVIQRDNLNWLPVRDRAGLIGLLALDIPTENNPNFIELKKISPFLFSYLERNYEYETVSQHELLDLETKRKLNLDSVQTSERVEGILISIARSFKDIFECDNCRIFWRDSPELLRLRAEVEPSDELDSTIRVDEDPVIEEVIEDEKSVIMNDFPEDNESTSITKSVRSFMAVPFRYNDRVHGTINLSSSNPGVYTEDDLHQFSALSDKLASVFAITQEYVNLTEYIEKILTNLPVGVLNLEINKDEIHLNQTAREIFSLERERISRENFEKHVKEVLISEDFLELLELSSESSDTKLRRFELQGENKHDKTIIKAQRTNVRNTEDVLSSILVVITDVTEQEELNRQVNRAERLAALGELASGIAHEIKNPLTSIQGFVQMMPNRLEDQEFMEKTSSILNRECSRLNSFIDNLLSFARPQVGHRTNFDFVNLLDDLKMLIKKRLEKNNVELILEVPEQYEMYGDPSKLQQVIMNLCLNSNEAISDRGKIKIRVREVQENSTIIEVEDDGEGMTDEQINQIFNPFYTTKDDGTGLGMAISHRIIEEHGGRINVESELGSGTKTTLILPSKDKSKRLHDEVQDSG